MSKVACKHPAEYVSYRCKLSVGQSAIETYMVRKPTTHRSLKSGGKNNTWRPVDNLNSSVEIVLPHAHRNNKKLVGLAEETLCESPTDKIKGPPMPCPDKAHYKQMFGYCVRITACMVTYLP
jgi:hypothetical protein